MCNKKLLVFSYLFIITIIASFPLSITDIPISVVFQHVTAQKVSSDTIMAFKNQTTKPISVTKSLILQLLDENLENKLNKSAEILEITSKLPEVKNIPYADSLNNTIRTVHGIPKDLDPEKRQVARDILSADKDLQVIFFLMANGDIYVLEPIPVRKI